MVPATPQRTRRLAAIMACLLSVFGGVAIAEDPDPALPVEPATIRSLLDEARFAEAEALAEQYVDEMRRSEGEFSLAYADALDLLVMARLVAGKAIEDRTETLAFEALEIKERILTEDRSGLVESLTNLGRLYLDRGESATARPYLELALTVGEGALGPSDPALIPVLRNLGNVLKALGELEAAEEAYLREGELIAEHRGPDHIDVAANSYNTGWLLVDLGDFAEAERRFDQALQIVEQSQGPESPRMVWVLLGLGTVRDFQGNYALAVATHERALEIAVTALGAEHPMVGSCETGLGAALMRLGDFEQARAALQRALVLTEQAYGADHENTGRTLKSLAEISYEMGETAVAETYLERAMRIFQGAGAEYLRLAAQVLEARNLAEQGADDEAIAGLRSALTEGEAALPDHPDLIIWEVALGEVLLEAGRTEDAAETLRSAVERAENLGGVEYQAYLDGLTKLATALARSGDQGEALDVAVRSENLSIRRARLLTSALPERQALRVAEARPSNTGLLLTLAAATGDDEITRMAWNAVIRSRAAVLDELAFRRRLASAGHLDEAILAEYAAASRRLANLLVHGMSGGDSDRFNQLVSSARKRRENAETRLAVASQEYRRLESEREIDLKGVLEAVPKDSALVAFVLYPFDSLSVNSASAQPGQTAKGSEQWRYAAFVVGGADQSPRMVPLGSAKEIDAAIAEWREAIHEGLTQRGDAVEQSYRTVAQQLRQEVWDPVAASLGDVERFYVVPAGQLNLVNFAALPSGDTGYLVDDLNFHYLSAERDLASSPSEAEGSGLLALGGANYQDTTLFAALREPGFQVASISGMVGVGDDELRGVDNGVTSCPAFRDIHFASLPGAEEEAQAIASRWKDIEEPALGSATLLMKGDATEARFKAEAPGRRVLHLATHGFFLNGECPSAAVGQRGIGGLAGSAKTKAGTFPVSNKESPLRLSGLALAGANHRVSASLEEEDGILTAEEIAALDLSGVQWAVLSGCDTGLGEIQTGEGVFGLRRAFQTAGAQTLIMSLWPVRDDATAEWMGALYDARLTQGADTITATTAASRSILERRREKQITTHPAFWGGFVASGGWG